MILLPTFQTGMEIPKLSAHFTDGQWVVLCVGCWIVLWTQISMVVYFWSAWVKGAYMNSGTGVKDRDKNLELHEVRELKKDLFQYLTLIVFFAMTFTIPLLDGDHLYPSLVVATLGTGAFGNTVLNLFEKGKKLIVGEKKDDGAGNTIPD